ncbi:MAG TPA: hypothetical protein VMN82_17430 [Thermoanaerobaculia bacterium]|nr:hypothetical protein [Thermoanaerobaculia bacterium]
MSPTAISLLVFLCVFGGALLGIALRGVLPEHHLSGETKDVVKASIALIGTMSALVLGLLVASAKGTFDTQKDELTSLSAHVILLDNVFQHYGPDADKARGALRDAVADTLAHVSEGVGNPQTSSRGKAVYDAVLGLAPKDDVQKALKAEAQSLLLTLGQTRALMLAQKGSALSSTLLLVVVFWLVVNFVSFGLFAKPNPTATSALLIAALSVAGAIFLILEMDRPYDGLIHISDTPLREALAEMGK